MLFKIEGFKDTFKKYSKILKSLLLSGFIQFQKKNILNFKSKIVLKIVLNFEFNFYNKLAC